MSRLLLYQLSSSLCAFAHFALSEMLPPVRSTAWPSSWMNPRSFNAGDDVLHWLPVINQPLLVIDATEFMRVAPADMTLPRTAGGRPRSIASEASFRNSFITGALSFVGLISLTEPSPPRALNGGIKLEMVFLNLASAVLRSSAVLISTVAGSGAGAGAGG